MNEVTTTNLAEFGWRERKLACELLQASIEQGYPYNFDVHEVQLMFNRNSGNVFFTNSEFQVCMMNGDKLEVFFTTPYNGHEGFADELLQQFKDNKDSWHHDDVEYLHDVEILSDEEWEEYNGNSDEDTDADE